MNQIRDSDRLLFIMEVEIFGQQRHNTGDLLLVVKPGQAGRRLKVQRHMVVDTGHDLHQLQLSAELIQVFTQRLDEPGAVARVPPGVVACRRRGRLESGFNQPTSRKTVWTVTWSCGVRVQEVCLYRNPLRCLIYHRIRLYRTAVIQG